MPWYYTGEYMRKTTRRLFTVAFAAYILLMLWLLFFWRLTFLDRGEIRLFLIPFTSTKEFIEVIRAHESIGAVWHSVKNLLGNIIMFVPLGIFLPVLFKGLRRYGYFFITVFTAIAAAEIIQYLTRLGSCDVDDVIFNTVGATIGFIVCRVIFAKKFKEG